MALGMQTRSIMANAENDMFVIKARSWEIAKKCKKGLSISLFHAERENYLSPHHNGLFDRVLIAQVQAEGLRLMLLSNRDRHCEVTQHH